jgi:pilus assembly protein TadC
MKKYLKEMQISFKFFHSKMSKKITEKLFITSRGNKKSLIYMSKIMYYKFFLCQFAFMFLVISGGEKTK